jgi:hypothetical protein
LQLRAAFPDRQFVLLIWNEVLQAFDEDEKPLHTEIAPSLRLWTKSNDPKLERYKYYQVTKARLDVVKLRNARWFIFVNWTEVFTKSGTIQKRFERKIVEPDLEFLAF